MLGYIVCIASIVFFKLTPSPDFQGSSSLGEIASGVNDLLSMHQDQRVPCVNLLFHAFCEVSALMAKAQKESNEASAEAKGKGVGVQLTGDFVRRILMLPSVRTATRERIRELACSLALELDDVHITCLALLLAHMTVTTVYKILIIRYTIFVVT